MNQGDKKTHPLDGKGRTPLLPERYSDLGRLASGGMGEVRRARDEPMKRIVAIKILHWQHVDSDTMRGRFEHEVAVTASLQHPGVVPVHDRGVLADGRPWFSMQEVRGRTLDEAIREVHRTADRATVRSEVQHLLGIMLRITETLAYAHSVGVVHRDIKPGNLMVGEFGEALVMDWGIALQRGSLSDASGSAVDPRLTQDGDIVGTLAYMAPEQARNGPASPPADVFSLGLVLYEALTGARLLDGTAASVLTRLRRGGFDVRAGLQKNGAVVSDVLYAIVERAVAHKPEDRYESAGALAEDLRNWLDGDERRRRARALLASARKREGEVGQRRAALNDVQSELLSHKATIQPFDDVPAKLPLWRAEDRATELRDELEVSEAELVETLRLSLQYDSELSEARRALAAIARRKADEFEELGDTRRADQWRLVLRAHDKDQPAAETLGTVSVDSSPKARLTLQENQIVDRRWVWGPERELETTPTTHALPAGRYMLTLRAANHVAVRQPIWVRRAKTIELDPVKLPARVALGPDDVFVAAGWCIIGGDPIAPEPFARESVWVDSFVIRRFPVTNAEYLEFLNDLVDKGDEEGAQRYAPRLRYAAPTDGIDSLAFGRDASGRFILGTDDVEAMMPDWPVSLVDWYSACAYADWIAERTNQPWRLPSELEWEKAARGVDARPFPWGDQPESTWARMLGSTGEVPGCESVTGHPIDESPYGVRGMAGNVRDWCIEHWTRRGPTRPDGRLVIEARSEELSLRVIRGGAWNSVPSHARLAGRFGANADARFPVVGFRLAQSFR